jgi:tetratricopeptide (TPR) repeat protein
MTRPHLFRGLAQIQTNRAVPGVASCERALELDHNLAPAHAMIGLAKYRLGRSEETESHIEEALRLSPRDPFGVAWLTIAADANLFLGHDEQAVARLRGALALNPNNPYTNFLLAAALANLGRLDEAQAAVKAGLALNPAFTQQRIRQSKVADLANSPTLYGAGMSLSTRKVARTQPCCLGCWARRRMPVRSSWPSTVSLAMCTPAASVVGSVKMPLPVSSLGARHSGGAHAVAIRRAALECPRSQP